MVGECKINNKEDINLDINLELSYVELKQIVKSLREASYHATTNSFIFLLEGIANKLEKQITEETK